MKKDKFIMFITALVSALCAFWAMKIGELPMVVLLLLNALVSLVGIIKLKE